MDGPGMCNLNYKMPAGHPHFISLKVGDVVRKLKDTCHRDCM